MNRDLQFLFEIGALRRTTRQWQRFFGTDFQNVTEHTYRTIWLALTLAAREGLNDTTKIIKMALVHDITESRTNDVDYLSRQYVDRKEEPAIEDMLADTSAESEMLEIWKEYEKRESPEAKLVKDADNLEVDLEIREQAANGVPIERIWKDTNRKRVREILFTESAKELFDEIYEADPHDWHTKGRNRLNDGDWTKKDDAASDE
jgi:putative hydrolase of HD superfamily